MKVIQCIIHLLYDNNLFIFNKIVSATSTEMKLTLAFSPAMSTCSLVLADFRWKDARANAENRLRA